MEESKEKKNKKTHNKLIKIIIISIIIIISLIAINIYLKKATTDFEAPWQNDSRIAKSEIYF